MNKEQKLKYWKSIIDECYSSDQTVISWCAVNGINESVFYKWRKVIYPNYSKSSKGVHSLFSPVAVDRSSHNISITVNDVKISFDDCLLERVIGALK